MNRREGSLISAAQISKVYPDSNGEDVLALTDMTLEVGRSEFVSLIGPSGCGKSTLLNIVAGFIEPTTGEVTIGGRTPERARAAHEIGMVFQDPVLLPWKTVRKNAGFLLDLIREDRSSAETRVTELLRTVGLEKFGDKFPHQLSGGMRQRVAIARALSIEPLVLLMDEPFGALDEFTRYKMNHELLRIWSQTQTSVVFVTHNVAEAVYLSDRVVAMSPRPGRILEVVDIHLDRPRTRQQRYTDAFTEYVVRLQELLEAEAEPEAQAEREIAE